MGQLVMVDITIHNPLKLSSAMSLVSRLLSHGVHEKQRDCCCHVSVIQIPLFSSNQRYFIFSYTNQISFLAPLLKSWNFDLPSVAVSSSSRRSPWAWLYDTFIRSWGIIYSFFTVRFRRWRSYSRNWQRVSLWSGHKRRQRHNTCRMGSSAYDHGTSLSGCGKGLNFMFQLDDDNDWFAVSNFTLVLSLYRKEYHVNW